VAGNPRLLRRTGRRGYSRRLVFAGALAVILVVAPGASGLSTAVNVAVTITGTSGSNGWYRSNVTVSWETTGETGDEGCQTQTLIVDTPGTKITCRAWNDTPPGPPIEEEVTKSVTIKLDKTAPAMAGAADRSPDANGWYNHGLTVAFSGTDATSGLASCSSARYDGPDNATALIAGSCSDNAGNAAGSSFAFKYDATPPSLFSVTAKRGNRSAELTWRMSTDTQVIEVLRAPGRNGQGETVVYRGDATGYRDTGLVVGRKYEYRVAGIDAAANRTERKIEFLATGALLYPAAAERVTSPPNLAWTRVKGASYYNLQLVRGRKVLSAWPLRTNFRLRRTWTYRGRRYRLRPGVYRWYVWPGFGRISAARYGRLLGSSTFVVAK
jgi:hypothetical protein